MNIVLLGPPGAGKGTLAGMMKASLEIAHISTGDLLRAEMKEGTELGKTAKQYVESGGLVPDELIIKLIENKLTLDASVSKGYLLDGFPRTTKQAEELDVILKQIAKPIDLAVAMDISLEVIIKRLTGRRICRKCGAIYHMTNMPPKQDGICDVCEGELYERPDDNEATIKNRMTVYEENTAPIIQYYEKQGKLQRLNAEQETKELMNGITKILNDTRPSDQDQIPARS